jgi:hypothetical protein
VTAHSTQHQRCSEFELSGKTVRVVHIRLSLRRRDQQCPMIRKLLHAADNYNGSEDPPRLVWDPTPSAPDHIRNRLFLSLANEPEEASLGTTAVSNLLRLTDVDLACSQAPANADAVSAAKTCIYERKQEQNRQAQKRFRSRKKVQMLSQISSRFVSFPASAASTA